MLFHLINLHETDLISILITIYENFQNYGKLWKIYYPGPGGVNKPASLEQYRMGAKLFSGTTYMRNNIVHNKKKQLSYVKVNGFHCNT